MSPLAASWAAVPHQGVDLAAVLDAPVARAWHNALFSVVASGLRTSLAIDDHLVVAVDGRLDAVAGVRSPAAVDVADVISQEWRRRGPAVLDDLLGDLLIVVYDRATGLLSVARDLTGARPGYITAASQFHLVVTHLPALVRSRQLPLSPNPDWTVAYLAARWPESRLTPFSGVTAVLPGHVAQPDGAGWRQSEHAHWKLTEPPRRTDAETTECFRDLFDDAVRVRVCDIDAGVAVTTSGGLDSTSALVTARFVRPDADLHALAIPFTDPDGDERHFQRAVASAAGATMHWVDVSGTGPFGDGVEKVLDRYGAPPLTPNWFFHSALEDAAAACGSGQVLDGEDGDGVLGGNPKFLADLLGRGHLVSWLREARALHHVHGDTFAELRRMSRFRLRTMGRAHGPGHIFAGRRRNYVRGGYLTRLMEGTYDDWARIDGGVGHPFLDRRVIEFAIPLPWQHIVRGGQQKYVLRQAMRGRLPEEIRNRTGKAHLSAPFETMLGGAQRGTLEEGLALARADISGTFAAVDWPDITQRLENGDHYAAYRIAMVAFWQRWIAVR